MLVSDARGDYDRYGIFLCFFYGNQCFSVPFGSVLRLMQIQFKNFRGGSCGFSTSLWFVNSSFVSSLMVSISIEHCDL